MWASQCRCRLLRKAEGAGFEPANALRRLRFSRLVHSTALPPRRLRYSVAAEGRSGFGDVRRVEQPAGGRFPLDIERLQTARDPIVARVAEEQIAREGGRG